LSIARRDDPDIDDERGRPAHRLRLALLKQPQEPRLRRQRQLDHLVEKERSPFRGPHQADVVRRGTGERPANVAEELAVNDRLGDRTTVDGHEAPPASSAVVVNPPGEVLLADTRLAGDQNSAVGSCGSLDKLDPSPA
jgi:hypothetical protein